MKYPYLLMSDTHYHAWSQFATVDSVGVNTRLLVSIEETKRAVEMLKKHGGNTLVHAGDMFHVRGQLAPTVLNPVMDTYSAFIEDGVQVLVEAGNHDLEGRESTDSGNASSSLEHLGALVVAETTGWRHDNIVMIPWDHDLKRLRKTLQMWADEPDASIYDVVIHAPVNGVIKGIPDHGLEAEELANYGFKRVFCGHYHNHKELVPGKVWSIGALTHQTWGDVGSKAGFMIVWEDEVKWISTRAPQFVEIDGDTAPVEIPLIVDGNYVKARCKIVNESEAAELRKALDGFGAAGVVIHAERDTTATSRTGSSVSAGKSLSASISEFIEAKSYADELKLGALCERILNEVEVSA